MTLLKTKRARLRAFRDEDFSDLRELMTDSDVMKFTGFRRPQSIEKIKECLCNWTREGTGPLGVWCAEEKDSGDFIGWFMLKDTGNDFPEIGFMLSKQKWNQGLATEIARALVDYATNKLNYEKVMATTVSENLASITILKKLGMENVKTHVESDSGLEILTLYSRGKTI